MIIGIISYYRDLLSANFFWLKRTLFWAVFWFGIGIVAYAARPDLGQHFFDFIQNIFKDIFDGQNPGLNIQSVLLIYKNNLAAAVIVLFGGLVFGIIPMISLAFNFFILGYIFSLLMFTQSLRGIMLFIYTIVPHGIVEIPLLVICVAFGLRFGFFWRDKEPMSLWQKFKRGLSVNIKILPLLVFGFFLAAIIEIFVSGYFAEKYLH